MIPEVLAPASSESLVAAVRGGADAVYLGAEGFNARARAHNFTNDALRQAVEYCHVRGVRVYVTMNTLVRPSEWEDARALARQVCESGADAIIVQDPGLARLLHAAAPQMPLHASTQMSCHSPAGVRMLREMGFSRVILSREMSLREIEECIGLGCEIEVFVHGALCMCVSGQCYLSSVLGGRSGNRGACAQPCRLPFRAGRQNGPARDTYALSLKDNCLYPWIGELARIGVTSLKIEGRMKRPEYVAAAAAVYRAAARGQQADPQLLRDLQAVFSRSGFTDGYLTAQRGAPMFGNRRHEDVTAADTGVLGRLARLYEKETPRVPLRLSLSVPAQGDCSLTADDGQGHTVTVSGPAAQPAERVALRPDLAAGQLQKTGGTPFAAQEITCAIADGMTLPVSALNALRRDALAAMAAERGKTVPVPFAADAEPAARPGHTKKLSPPPLVVRLATAAQLPAVLREPQAAAFWIVPAELAAQMPAGVPFGVELPRGMFGTEETVRGALRQAVARGAQFALCGQIGAVALALEERVPVLAGFGNNLSNRAAAEELAARGVRAGIWSFELPPAEYPADPPFPMGAFVYGRQPLMLTRNCPVSAAQGCAGCGGHGALTDRTGTVFPVMCRGGCSELLNAHTLYLADRLTKIPAVDFWYLHMTDETPEGCLQILRQYRSGGPAKEGITRGVYGRSSV